MLLNPSVLRVGLFSSLKRSFYSTQAATVRLIPDPVYPEETEKPVVSKHLMDDFDRHHNYLRISLTERCNLRCTYCMPEEGVPLTPNDQLLSKEEILRLARLFVSQGVTKIRLTGGEPTVRPDIIELVQHLGQLKQHGLQSLAMTSNGIALKRKLPALVAGGLDTLNVSLDTLDPHLFQIMTRRKGFDKVTGAIDEAVRLRMPHVKINTVVMRGVNDQEVLNFAAYTKENPVNVRFIEYMPFDGNKWNRDKLVPFKELVDRIESMYGRLDKLGDGLNDTTKHYRVPGYQGKLGFITSMTEHFCGTCNRLRITADGNIKVCLFGNAEVSLRDMMRQGKTDEQLLEIIGAAVKKKKKQHAVVVKHRSVSSTFSVPLHLLPPTSSLLQFNSTRFYSSSSNSRNDDEAPRLTHTDPHTGEARMVSVTDKVPTKREAKAIGRIILPDEAYRLLKQNHVQTLKGNVLTVAQIAGIQAAKATSNLIPLCHPLLLGLIDVRLWLDDDSKSVECESTVQTSGKTGVEMEALTATSVALLTVYDMCKAASKDMVIEGIRVVEKTGGKSGPWKSSL
ncbi:molybdenum cofactor biosynthesis prote [Mucor lusitanicus]|uniref:Molybdenum cofactor biosynthesis prote n=1 Tax=Mucor circinelloides f. lusitanicus TaxID=29924 RepID=A0A8H4F044_MUCCL|nr:molybdenum cofactor biosynthesis prote [Mucor lusitanicus]